MCLCVCVVSVSRNAQNHNSKSKRERKMKKKERHSLVFIPHDTGFLMEIRALLRVLYAVVPCSMFICGIYSNFGVCMPHSTCVAYAVCLCVDILHISIHQHGQNETVQLYILIKSLLLLSVFHENFFLLPSLFLSRQDLSNNK